MIGQTDYSRIRDLIRWDIVQDRLKGGSRLKIKDLAARYSTSPVPVREALQQLQGEGIVKFIANRGASVRTIDTDFVRDIYEIRALVEPFLARWFVRHHSTDALEKLENIQRELDAAIEAHDYPRQRRLDLDFHAVIYLNHYNEEAVHTAYKHIDLLTALTERFPRTNSRALIASREHWAMIAAIRAEDEAKMAKLLELHIRRAGEDLIDRMKAAHRKQEVGGSLINQQSGAPVDRRGRGHR